MVSFTKVAFFFASFSASVLAVNDWSKPCFNGVCEYSLPASTGTSGSLKIWGSADAITDITKAAGWEIFECDPEKLAQDIRLVCSTDEESSGCAHLYQTIGAEGKIVRLPESCGKNAFARISKAWVPENQDIPDSVAKRLVRRAGEPPLVKALRLDTDFSAIDVSKAGSVKIAILGANAPGLEDGIGEEDAPTRNINSRVLQPRLFGFVKKAAAKVGAVASSAVGAVTAPVTSTVNKVLAPVKKVVAPITNAAKKVIAPVKTAAKKVIAPVKTAAKKAAGAVKTAAKKVVAPVKTAVNKAAGAVKTAAKKVGSAAKTAVNKVGAAAKKVVGKVDDAIDGAVDKAKDIAGDIKDKVGDVAEDIKDAGGKILDAAKDVNDVDVNQQKTLPPINVNKKFTLLDKSVPCGNNTKAGVKIAVDAKANAVVGLGIVASGTIVPPKFDEFQISSTITADLDSKVTFTANVNGAISSPDLKLFEVGIPGFDFPGILAVGPTFTINANAKASLDLSVNLDVGIKYKINQAKLVFPPNGEKGGSFDLDDTPLSLSATPSVKATGKLEAHLIPSLNLGLTALGDKVKAVVFLNLDATASATIALEATGPTLNGQIGRREPEFLALPPRAEDDVPRPVPKKTTAAAKTASTAAAKAGSADKAATKADDATAATADAEDATADDVNAAGAAKAGTAGATDAKDTGAAKTAGTANKADAGAAAKADTGAAAKADAGATAKADTGAATKADTGAATKAATGDAAAAKTGADAAKDAKKFSVDSSKAGFGGCFTVAAGLSVNAGADGEFFGLFNKETKVALFKKDFKLFEKCFGNKSKRSAFEYTRLVRSSLEARQSISFKCPKNAPAPAAVTNETVPAARAN